MSAPPLARRERLAERHRRKIIGATLHFQAAHDEAMPLPYGSPERSHAIERRKDARCSLLWHAARLRAGLAELDDEEIRRMERGERP